jgi:tetratricopeptide (TPR) repeat protein
MDYKERTFSVLRQSHKDAKKGALYILCFLFFILSILSKPIAVTFFLLLISYDIFILREKIKKTILDKIPFIAVSLALVYITVTAQSAMGAVKKYHGGSLFTNLITIPKGILHYFKIILFPKDLMFYYDIEPAQSIFSLGVIFGMVTIAFLVFILVKNRSKNGVISLGVAMFFIFLLPVCNIIPIEIIAADRYLYIPLAGLGISFFSFIDANVKSYKKAFYTLTIFVMILFSYITVNESFSWMKKEGIWENILQNSPANMRAMNNLIELYMTKGDNDKAFELINKALSVDSKNTRILKNYALYKNLTGGSKNEVLELLGTALENDPYDKEIYLEMAKVYFEKKEYDKALDIINKGMGTIYQFPLDVELNYHYVLANIYVKKIMFNEAINEFKFVIKHSNNYPDLIKKYALLLENVYDFDKYKSLYVVSCGSNKYREKLEAIFTRLNLKEEGMEYLNNLDKRFK